MNSTKKKAEAEMQELKYFVAKQGTSVAEPRLSLEKVSEASVLGKETQRTSHSELVGMMSRLLNRGGQE